MPIALHQLCKRAGRGDATATLAEYFPVRISPAADVENSGRESAGKFHDLDHLQQHGPQAVSGVINSAFFNILLAAGSPAIIRKRPVIVAAVKHKADKRIIRDFDRLARLKANSLAHFNPCFSMLLFWPWRLP